MPPRSKQSLPDPADAPRRTVRSRAVRGPAKVQVDVTAVLVAHDGALWLPEVLAALAASTRVPVRVVCVDTGSTDTSAELLAEAYGEVLRLPRTTGYGEAVAKALGTVPATTWVWLLHDDVAVDPTTLQALLDHAATSPSAALLGPKVIDWHDPRYLVEVGVTTDVAGHRETGLERREYDQGQHDGIRDVLAVGTAAALVRRDVWDATGGLDPALPVFRDDLDLGWKVNAAGHRVVVVPQARVRHVRASTTGHRVTDAAPGRASGTDRRHALWVLLVHAGTGRLVGTLPRLAVTTVLRSLALLLTRQVGAASDEWRALLGVLRHPAALHRARRFRASVRTVPNRALRPLFASRLVRIRARTGVLAGWLSGGPRTPSALGALGDPGPEGPDALDSLDAGPGVLRTLLLRPGVLLFLGLSVVALVAERSVLWLYGGTLHGGALLGAPGGARDLWSVYVASWHDVSVGSSTQTPPVTGAMALLSSLLLGKPWLAVDTLLLASVPLAGVSAYLAATRLIRHLYLRLWAAATWALLPVATGAVAAGRLDAAAVQVALPLLALATGRVLTRDPRRSGWWRVWALGLVLGVVSAFAPLLWPIVGVVLLVGAAVNLAVEDGRARALACVAVAVVPGLVLFPWSLGALAHPSEFALGQQPADAAVPAWHLLLLSPGGPGTPPALLTVGLVLAALGGLVRLSFRPLAQGAWFVALLGLAVAGLLARVQVGHLPVWPGLALQVAGLAMVLAALVAANGLLARLSGHSFGWRQLTASVVAVAAAALPVLAALSWVQRGADSPLVRDHRSLLPAFAAAELQANPGLRALLLVQRPDGRVAYSLTTGDPVGLQDSGLHAGSSQSRALDRVVADLLSPRGSDAAEALSTRAVRYVALRATAGTGPLVDALDAQVGLVRRTSGSVDLWHVAAPAARLSVLPPPLAARALAGDWAPRQDLLHASPPTPLPAGAESARAVVPAGPPGRLLVLADARDGGWRVTLDGHVLPAATAWGWAQAFVLPPAGGQLRLVHTRAERLAGLVLQAVFLLALLVLAVPAGRRGRGLEDDVVDLDVRDAPELPQLRVAAP